MFERCSSKIPFGGGKSIMAVAGALSLSQKSSLFPPEEKRTLLPVESEAVFDPGRSSLSCRIPKRGAHSNKRFPFATAGEKLGGKLIPAQLKIDSDHFL